MLAEEVGFSPNRTLSELFVMPLPSIYFKGLETREEEDGLPSAFCERSSHVSQQDNLWGNLSACQFSNQLAEANMKRLLLNRYAQLGMTIAYREG